VGLVVKISAVAVAKGAAAGTTTLTLVKGALKLMAWTQMKTAVAVVGIFVVGGTATITFQTIKEHDGRAWRTEVLNTTNLHNILKGTPTLVEILPTKFPQATGWGYIDGNLHQSQRLAGVNQSLSTMLYLANPTDIPLDRLLFPNDFPTNKYDFFANFQTNARPALQKEIERIFNLVERIALMETNVFALQIARKSSGLKLHQGPPNSRVRPFSNVTPTFSGDDVTMANFAAFLESYANVPVIDRTGLTNHFDIRLVQNSDKLPVEWKDHHLGDFQPALLDQLGLELVPTNMTIEMLVVEKVK
jgi:uncharacterized protein (TIGR03435 family)